MRNRKYLTANEMRDMLERQAGVCFSPECMSEGPFIGEHWLPVALGNYEKPDCLLCVPCAKAKTYGSPGRVGGDIRDIKHIRKLEEKRTQADRRAERGPKLRSNSKLQSRGFDKSLSKKFDGTLVRK